MLRNIFANAHTRSAVMRAVAVAFAPALKALSQPPTTMPTLTLKLPPRLMCATLNVNIQSAMHVGVLRYEGVMTRIIVWSHEYSCAFFFSVSAGAKFYTKYTYIANTMRRNLCKYVSVDIIKNGDVSMYHSGMFEAVAGSRSHNKKLSLNGKCIILISH